MYGCKRKNSSTTDLMKSLPLNDWVTAGEIEDTVVVVASFECLDKWLGWSGGRTQKSITSGYFADIFQFPGGNGLSKWNCRESSSYRAYWTSSLGSSTTSSTEPQRLGLYAV